MLHSDSPPFGFLPQETAAGAYPLDYGFNFGTCIIWNPAKGRGGDGVFYPNAKRGPGAISDGLSKTLMIAEVKAFTPYARDLTGVSSTPPTSAEAFSRLVLATPEKKLGPKANDNTGHTEWQDGAVHHTGFTTTMTPNAKVLAIIGGIAYDVDFNSQREGRSATNPTYTSITSRSFHPGGIVNVGFMDGSVRSIDSAISTPTWRDLGTRAGGEIVSQW